MRMTFAGCSTGSVTCRSSSPPAPSSSGSPPDEGAPPPVTAMPFGPITTMRGSRSSEVLALGSFVGCSVMHSSLTSVETGSADGQEHLADALAGLDLRVRGRGIGERETGMHQGSYGAGGDQRPHVLDHCGTDRRLLLDRPRAKRRGEDRAAFPHELAEVQLALGTSLHADHDQPAFEREDVDVAPEVLGSHVVQDDVG